MSKCTVNVHDNHPGRTNLGRRCKQVIQVASSDCHTLFLAFAMYLDSDPDMTCIYRYIHKRKVMTFKEMAAKCTLHFFIRKCHERRWKRDPQMPQILRNCDMTLTWGPTRETQWDQQSTQRVPEMIPILQNIDWILQTRNTVKDFWRKLLRSA